MRRRQGDGYEGRMAVLLKSLRFIRQAPKKLHLRLRPCNIARSMTAALNHYLSRVSHLRLPKICVAVTGSDALDLVEKAEAIVRDNTFIEVRLDFLSRPGLAIQKVKDFTDP